jgi:hypothetical protein
VAIGEAEIKSGHIDSATLSDMKVRVFGDTAGKWLAIASQTALIK